MVLTACAQFTTNTIGPVPPANIFSNSVAGGISPTNIFGTNSPGGISPTNVFGTNRFSFGTNGSPFATNALGNILVTNIFGTNGPGGISPTNVFGTNRFSFGTNGSLFATNALGNILATNIFGTNGPGGISPTNVFGTNRFSFGTNGSPFATNVLGNILVTNIFGTNGPGGITNAGIFTGQPARLYSVSTNYGGIVTNAGWTLTLTAPQGFNFTQGVFENSNLVQVVGGNIYPDSPPTNSFTLNLTTNEWKAGWMNLGYGSSSSNSISFDIPFSGISNTVGNYFATVPWTNQNQFNAIYNSNSLAGQQLYLVTTPACVQIITTNYY